VGLLVPGLVRVALLFWVARLLFWMAGLEPRLGGAWLPRARLASTRLSGGWLRGTLLSGALLGRLEPWLRRPRRCWLDDRRRRPARLAGAWML